MNFKATMAGMSVVAGLLGCAHAQVTAPAAPAPAAAPQYGANITLEQARKALAAGQAEARRNNWPVAIAVVDTAGNLVAYERLDNTQTASVQISLGKARTAATFRRPTKALQDGIAAGGAGLRFLSLEGATPIDGGLPLLVDGKIVGGIGVSGVTSEQDAQVARAGVEALAK